MERQPSNNVLKFLRWFCPPELLEGIEGDLLEDYYNNLERIGEDAAQRRLIVHVLQFLRPGLILRNKFSLNLNIKPMFANYFKVMLRHCLKRKFYTAINIFGLTIGIVFALLIGVHIYEEANVNHTLKDNDRLYLLESNGSREVIGFPFLVPSPIAKTTKEEYPTLLEDYYRFSDRSVTVSKGDKHFRIQSIIGDSTFLKMFGFPVLFQNRINKHSDRYALIITERMARQFFERSDVVGESLTLTTEAAGKKDYVISAVLKDIERNSITNLMNMDAQMFLSIDNLVDFGQFDPESWAGGQMVSYVKLAKGATVDAAEKALSKVFKSNASQLFTNSVTIKLNPLNTYHVTSNNGIVQKQIIALSAVAFFILLLAVANFVNISIGTSISRIKEIGVRKAIGGVRKEVIFQFMLESFAVTILAFVLSLGIYQYSKDFFSNITGNVLPSLFEIPLMFWKFAIPVIVFTAIASGAYPSFFISSFKTLVSLKGKINSVGKEGVFSKGLIGLQFLCAIGVFIFALTVSSQVSFFLDKDLGYDKSSVLTVSSVPRIWNQEGVKKLEAVRSEFLSLPQVNSATLSWEIPNGNYGNNILLYNEGKTKEEALTVPLFMADENFASTYKIDIVEGSFLTPQSNPFEIVINEEAQRVFKVDVGDKLRIATSDSTAKIIGIVKDFNFFSLHEKLRPVAFIHLRNTNVFRYFSFKLEPGNLSESVEAVHSKWRNIFPDDPFDYAFVDEKVSALYKTETQLKQAFNIATVIMLILVLTGVLGIVSLAVSRKTKEIGIRKVLGASILNILMMLFKDYAKVVVIAFTLVSPITYYFISIWLSNYAYAIEIQWWMFTVPGVIVFFVTMVIVIVHSLHTVRINPAITLKQD
ncbi:ABC transporter permease [Chryseosolibacter indicus]|nr:ABC transporter permease [Chryseosolibacter indicus]